jgi:predicted transcriptional regulator
MSSNDAIARLHTAVSALGDVDVSGWDDATLRDHLVELSVALCRVDEQLSRLADGVRARGFRIVEPALVVEIVPATQQEAILAETALAEIGRPVTAEPVAA